MPFPRVSARVMPLFLAVCHAIPAAPLAAIAGDGQQQQQSRASSGGQLVIAQAGAPYQGQPGYGSQPYAQGQSEPRQQYGYVQSEGYQQPAYPQAENPASYGQQPAGSAYARPSYEPAPEYSLQPGAYSPPQPGAYPAPQAGAYPPPQPGAYPPAQAGPYPAPQAGAYPAPQAGAYPAPQPTTTGYPGPYEQQPGQVPLLQGRVAEAPAGLLIPITLNTAISTQVAKAGDYVQGTVDQNVQLGNGVIPQGSVVSGQVTDATAGKLLNRTGKLSIAFNQLRTPDGATTPITGHLVGDIGKYAIGSNGQVKGEGWGTKLTGIGLRTGVGAGAGAALGTALAAIAGGGIGTGAWAGTAIGGGGGLLEALVLRKGRNVIIPSGTNMQFQLDQPASISGALPPPYTGIM